MRHSTTRWLEDTPIHDPLARRQAQLLQIALIILFVGACCMLPFGVATDGRVDLFAYPLVMVCCVGALLVLRRGKIAGAVALMACGILGAIGMYMFVGGIENSPDILIALAFPVTVAGLVLGRTSLAWTFGATVIMLVTIAVIQTVTQGIAATMPVVLPPFTIVITVIIFLGVLCLVLDTFSSALRTALAATQAREHDLERLRASLEATVGERTAALQQALADVEQREARLVQALEDLQTSQHVILELRTPTIPVLPGVLVVPLVGALDGQRTASVTHTILSAVERERAHELILDVTGVPLLDSEGAQVLISTTNAVRLLGARVWMVGVRPEVAQTIVALGIDLRALQTSADLREAIARLSPNA